MIEYNKETQWESGVYKITNTINNKSYIGSTTCFYNRWNSHKSTLLKQKHCNIYLQRSYNKYGKDNFKFSILIITKKLEKYEKILIAKLKPEYNIKQSVERSQQACFMNSVYYSYDRFGNFIEKISFNNICKKYKVSYRTVLDYLRGNVKTCANHRFYLKPQKNLEVIPFGTSRTVYLFNLNGNLVKTFYSIKSASKFLNLQKITTGKYIKRDNVNLLLSNLFLSENSDIETIREKIKLKRKRFVYVYYNGNCIKRFNSTSDAAVYYNILIRRITNAIRLNKPINKLYFSYNEKST